MERGSEVVPASVLEVVARHDGRSVGGRYPTEMRLEIGQMLLAGMPRGTVRALARALDRTTRCLRGWKDLAEKAEMDEAALLPRAGRPRHPERLHELTREATRLVLDLNGWDVGEAVVAHELGGIVSLALVRRALRELKAERKKRRDDAMASQREHVHVEARNALWSIDGTHLGRGDDGAAVVGEVVRDVASTSTLVLSIGPAPTSKEVATLLDRTVDETGETPEARWAVSELLGLHPGFRSTPQKLAMIEGRPTQGGVQS